LRPRFRLAPHAGRIDVFELSQPDFSRELSQPIGEAMRAIVGVGKGSDMDGLLPEAGLPEAWRRFVAGEENRLAFAGVQQFAADAVRDAQATESMGPGGGVLVLYGASGTGKTHLVEGLLEAWSTHLAGDVIVTLDGSEFARRYADAVERDDVETFRRHVRGADLLVLEDAGRLAPKPPAQWELIHTLDALAQRGAYVVVTLDAAPQTFEALLPALVGRLAEGSVFGLLPPSSSSRLTILAELARERGLQLEPKALDLLAADRETTVRELRGTVVSLEAEAKERARREAAGLLFPVRGDEPPAINVPQMKRFLDAQPAGTAPTLKQIVEQTARHFGLKAADLKSGSRRRSVVVARDTAIFLARRLTKKSLQEIGDYFGGRDHTTVLHSCRKLEAQDELDPAQRAALAALRERLQQG
jgi:chromosomal replication initiator protein